MSRVSVVIGIAAAVALGMVYAVVVACCAHHVADLTPLIGVSGAAVFLTTYRLPIMLVGIAVNAVGGTVAIRWLRRTPVPVLPSVAVGK